MSLNNTEEMSMENNDPMITAVELEQEILSELNNGVFRLKNGIPLGVGDDCEMQYDVTFRELTAGDVIDAQVASERVVSTPQGPQLVSSPAQMGLEMLRRQIASIGTIKGPVSLIHLKKMSHQDFHRLSLALELKDQAAASALGTNRGRVVAVSDSD